MDHALRLLLAGGVDPIDAFRIACLNPGAVVRTSEGSGAWPRATRPTSSSSTRSRTSARAWSSRTASSSRRTAASSSSRPATRPPSRDSVNIKWLTEEDFRIPARAAERSASASSRRRPGSIVTGERIVEPKVEDGLCVADVSRDLLKIFVIERHTGSGNIGKGFISGFGLDARRHRPDHLP